MCFQLCGCYCVQLQTNSLNHHNATSIVTLLIIPNILFVVVLALLTGYLTFLTTKGGLTDNRYKGYWKRLTKRGKEVFFVLLTIGLVLVFQEINTQSKNKLSETTLKTEQNERDSLITIGITKGVDSSRKILFDDISKAFLKQELELDTVKKEVVRIRDSARTITNNYEKEDAPVIMIDSTGIALVTQNNTERKYSISFKSADAGSTNFNTTSYFVIPIEYNVFDVNAGDIFPRSLQIPKNGVWSTDFTIHIDPNPFELYVNVVGTYSNLEVTKTYKINNVYVFDMKTSRVRTLIGMERQKILGIVESNTRKDIKSKK